MTAAPAMEFRDFEANALEVAMFCARSATSGG